MIPPIEGNNIHPSTQPPVGPSSPSSTLSMHQTTVTCSDDPTDAAGRSSARHRAHQFAATHTDSTVTMKQAVWHGRRDVRVDTVPDPRSRSRPTPSSRITSSGMCGSDLHLYEVMAPFMTAGDVLGPRADGHRRGGRPGGHQRRARRPRRRSPSTSPAATASCAARGCSRSARRPRSATRAGRGAVRLHQAVRPGARRAGRVPAGARTRSTARSRCPRARADDRFVYLSDVLPTAWQAVRVRGRPAGRQRGRARSGPDRRHGGRIARTWASSSHRHRPRARAPRAGARARRRRSSTSHDHEDDVGDAVRDADRRPRSGRGHRRRRHGGPRLAGRRSSPRRSPALLPDAITEKLMQTRRRRSAGRAATRPSTSSAAAARSRSSACTAGMTDPMPMMTLFDKQIQLRMGQANVQALGRRHPAAR